MTTESLAREVDSHIITILSRLSALRENNAEVIDRKPPMSIEARSLELWRAVAVECFATFLFSLVVAGAAAASAVSGSGLSVLATAIASGFTIAAISLIFSHISGGHVNPAVSLSFALCRRISPLRAVLYIAAQCGGGIAGAAMLYGVTTPSNTQTLTSPGRLGGPIERLLVEIALSVLIVLAHFAADSSRALPPTISSKASAVLAAAYTAATLVSSPFLNPARALGPAFVMNRWDNHWVYWVGPLSGGAVAALLHEYVLSPRPAKDSRDMDDGDNSSMRSDEDTYDDLDKPNGPKFPSAYATYRPVAGASSSIYSAPPTALERVESIYGGTKSLYCKSPPLTRANLNRSQSVYAKSTSGPRDGLMIPKPGPLVPAQSLYPIRLGQNGGCQSGGNRESQPIPGGPPSQSSQNHNSTNQNMQNQLQQCTQSIYGIRGISTSLSTRENGIYGVSTGSSVYGRAPAPPPSSQNSQQSGQSSGQSSIQNHPPPPPPSQQQPQQQQQQQQQHQRQNSPPPPSQSQQSQNNTGPPTPQTPQMQPANTPIQHKDFQERLNVFRGAAAAASSSGPHITGADLEGLADILKTEITSSLTNLIDSIVARFVQQRRFIGKQTEAAQAAAEQLNKDLLMASQMLERKSPRTKVVDRGAPQPPGGPNGPRGPLNGGPPPPQPTGFSQIGSIGGVPHGPHAGPTENNLNQMNQLPSHARPSVGMFQTPKPPTIYAMASMQAQQQQQHQQQHQQQREQQQREHQQRDQYCNMRNDERENRDSEQNEALSLVMTPKKKRHKVTDTRITPRTVSRILAQEGNGSQGGSDSPPPPPPPRPYHAPPPMLPVSLPTSVAIPNPSLHESQVFSPYSPFFNPHASHPGQVPPPGPHHLPASPPGGGVELRDSPPLPHPPAMLHPALLAAAQHGSPDYGHLRMDSNDRASDCNSGDITYDGIQPTSSTLTPMHLRKAKLMFFWVRYPSSAVLKMYFPDIKFNKNNTAQLVKWFSNFREFYYIQMEKYARQAVSEGVKNVEDLRVGGDSEIYRVLNLHYNRNNHIEVPSNFRYVVEQTLKEFFKAIQGGKDSEQSWKKSIYKVISRLDDPVPEYFKSPNFLEQLE